MARSHTPTALGTLLSSLVSQREWRRRLLLNQVFLFWDEVVGPEIASHAQPRVIRGEVLWLGVSDPMWMQQLQFEKVQLLSLLNARLKKQGKGGAARGEANQETVSLADLRFQLDPALGRQPAPPPEPLPAPTIDAEEYAQFVASLNSIPDQALREGMKRMWLAHHRGWTG
jgi:hypothetical protein